MVFEEMSTDEGEVIRKVCFPLFCLLSRPKKVLQESEPDDLEKRIPDEGMCASSSVPESGNF